MPALNHIIVPAKDKDASAKFLADILGVKAQPQWGPFRPVQTSNGVTLDFVDSKDVRTQHYAFLVDDEEFDASFAKLKKAGIAYFADPHKAGPGEINHHWGGRGVYFEDPNGHLLELITKPYGELPQAEADRYFGCSARPPNCTPRRPASGPVSRMLQFAAPDGLSTSTKRMSPAASVIDEGLAELHVMQRRVYQPGLVSIRIQVSGASRPMIMAPCMTLMSGPLFRGL